MKILIFVLCVLLGLGCNDKKVGISEGKNNEQSSAEISQRLENIDAQGYKGLEDVFANNVLIEGQNKPILLIFGSNTCKYCEDLKNEIKNNEALKSRLKADTSAYYINTSYSKNHKIAYLNKTMDTDSLSRHYNLGSTPLVIFLEPDGTQIANMTGYNKKMFLAMLDFSLDSNNYKDSKDTKIRMQHFLESFSKNMS